MNRRCRWDVNLRDQTALLENAHCDLHEEKVSFFIDLWLLEPKNCVRGKTEGLHQAP